MTKLKNNHWNRWDTKSSAEVSPKRCSLLSVRGEGDCRGAYRYIRRRGGRSYSCHFRGFLWVNPFRTIRVRASCVRQKSKEKSRVCSLSRNYKKIRITVASVGWRWESWMNHSSTAHSSRLSTFCQDQSRRSIRDDGDSAMFMWKSAVIMLSSSEEGTRTRDKELVERTGQVHFGA